MGIIKSIFLSRKLRKMTALQRVSLVQKSAVRGMIASAKAGDIKSALECAAYAAPTLVGGAALATGVVAGAAKLHEWSKRGALAGARVETPKGEGVLVAIIKVVAGGKSSHYAVVWDAVTSVQVLNLKHVMCLVCDKTLDAVNLRDLAKIAQARQSLDAQGVPATLNIKEALATRLSKVA